MNSERGGDGDGAGPCGCVILEGFVVQEDLDGRVGCREMQGREDLLLQNRARAHAVHRGHGGRLPATVEIIHWRR